MTLSRNMPGVCSVLRFIDNEISEDIIHLLENSDIAQLTPVLGTQLKIRAFRDSVMVSLSINTPKMNSLCYKCCSNYIYI